ncbi:MAG TPA: transglutaminase N-terminal domain-containing protein [Rubrivivax sp.]|nr:transglutaminase N-terminal domain-containing protein [Rubrivivax sp.]
MPIRHDIVHATLYRCREPAGFGQHRVSFRPRDSHDLRVPATGLVYSRLAQIRMIQDPHSDSVAPATPLRPADELKIVCTFSIEHARGEEGTQTPLQPLQPLQPRQQGSASWVPFDRANDLRPGTSQLIRAGVARDPRQAAPVSGSWFGPADACLGLSASVQVRRIVA